jgi:ribosome-associated translation inhibitor RaiA/cold shock CspA family protein
MKIPVQVSFHGLDASEALESAALARAEKLEQFCSQLTACRVRIEQVSKHKQQGCEFAVHVDVTLPGHELNVGHQRHEDAYVALRDAFNAMRRQVEEAVQRMRGEEKLHAVPLHGKVARLIDDGRYGFIAGNNGDEYYFAAENVVDTPFEHLREGAAVQFLPELGAQGRQARRVSLGRHGTP